MIEFSITFFLKNVSKPSQGLYGHTMSIIDDTVYLVGGTSGSVYFRSVFKFDLKKRDRWVSSSTPDELDQAPNDYLRI